MHENAQSHNKTSMVEQGSATQNIQRDILDQKTNLFGVIENNMWKQHKRCISYVTYLIALVCLVIIKNSKIVPMKLKLKVYLSGLFGTIQKKKVNFASALNQ